jgi:tetratricopeptide (TPR) repeat protein
MSSTKFSFTTVKAAVASFYGSNKKVLNIALPVLILIIGAAIFWTEYWKPKQESEAGAKLARLQHYFAKDSFDVVLKGIKGKKMATAPQIADDYGYTKKGKEAALMAAIAYMQTGKFEKAIKYYDKTDVNDIILAPSILAGKASCYSELGKNDKAAKLYEEAGDLGKNDYCMQFYFYAGNLFELSKEYKSAVRCYEKIKSQMGNRPTGLREIDNNEIDKYISKAKGLAGELN